MFRNWENAELKGLEFDAGDVEVYEVGKQQLLDWISSGSVYNPVYAAYPFVKGDYVIVLLTSVFGHMRSVATVWTGYMFLDEAMSKLPPAVEFSSEEKPWLTGVACDVEIWHVCDDGDLWQAWDAMSEVAAASGETVHDMEDVFAYQLMQEVEQLQDKAYEQKAFGAQVQGSYDLCDLLDFSWDDYDIMTEDARDAVDALYEDLTVYDYRYCNRHWNSLVDEEMTNRLIEHYAPRIWDDAGNVRTACSDE